MEHPEMLKREIKVLLFDQYGTIVDMQNGLTEAVTPFLQKKSWTGKPSSFVTWWRRTHFENSMIDALCDRGHTPYRQIGHRGDANPHYGPCSFTPSLPSCHRRCAHAAIPIADPCVMLRPTCRSGKGAERSDGRVRLSNSIGQLPGLRIKGCGCPFPALDSRIDTRRERRYILRAAPRSRCPATPQTSLGVGALHAALTREGDSRCRHSWHCR